jgi:molybdate transport system ATP-binding protein
MILDVDVGHRQGGFALEARFRSEGRLTALFGPSGSGKTTLVNAIGGLIRPSQGRIAVKGRVLVDTNGGVFVPKHRRRIGYVFQEGRLFPHLSVRRNLLFGRWFSPRRERSRASRTWWSSWAWIPPRPLALHPVGGREAAGGHWPGAARRSAPAAHGRAPGVLDEARKAEIYPYIERLRDEGDVPMVLVSHSVAEIARLATSIVMMAHGGSPHRGRPPRSCATPASSCNRARASRSPDRGPGAAARGGLRPDDPASPRRNAHRAAPRRGPRNRPAGAPEGAGHHPVPEAARGLERPERAAGTILSLGEGQGASLDVTLDCGGDGLVASVTRKSAGELGLKAGLPVHAIIKSIAFDRRPLAGRRPVHM